MQFDQARVAIRERTWSEMLDLALHVARSHLLAILVCGVPILPLAFANHWLVFDPAEDFTEESYFSSYYFLLLLVMIEAPMATALVTLYLGRALFEDRPDVRGMLRDFVGSLPQLFLLQVVVRTFLLMPIVTAFIPYALFPYLNEVILLERNPLSSRAGRVSTMKRNSQLHRGHSGEFMARALFAAGLSVLFILALVATQEFLWANLVGSPQNPGRLAIEVQAACWIVVLYFTVARFLNYLDQRIRNEGWEVELLLRAERENLLR